MTNRMKILFFDLETTGTNPGRHGIHQISGQVVVDGETKEEFNFFVQPNPKAQIEEEALQVCNVTREQILNYPPMKKIYDQLIDILSRYVDRYNKNDKFFLAGYNNSSFDNNFLRGFFLQNNDKYFGSWFWSNSIDVMILATPFLAEKRTEMPDFKQATVAKYLGVNVNDTLLHDANYDLALCREIYNKVCGRF